MARRGEATAKKAAEPECEQEACIKRRDGAYAVGRVAVLEELPKRFQKLAGDAFSAGDDKKAHLLRDLAKQFETEAEEARAAYVLEYHKGRN